MIRKGIVPEDEIPGEVWLVDPIGYSGLAYYDAGLAVALAEGGTKVRLVSSEAWMLGAEPRGVPRMAPFRGTHEGSRLHKGGRYLLSLVRLGRSARRHRPALIHWQYLELPLAEVLVMAYIKLLGIPQIYTAHELLPWNIRTMDRTVFRWIYGTVDRILVHRRHEAEQLRKEWRLPSAKVSVIGHGAYERFARTDQSQEQARLRLGLYAEAPTALFFGSIRANKGLDILIQAWSRVLRDVPNAELVVAGKPFKGLDPSAFERQAARCGVSDHVRFRFEQVDTDEANDYYRACDVVVLPYLEIVSSAVLRYAYSSERAVVATAVGEHPDCVIDGETGYLVEAGSSEALGETLSRVLRDRESMRMLGLNAAAYARREMGWAHVADQVRDVYVDALRSRRSASGQ
jgi:glycosyltransferase involved in cell wall biosynthesis